MTLGHLEFPSPFNWFIDSSLDLDLKIHQMSWREMELTDLCDNGVFDSLQMKMHVCFYRIPVKLVIQPGIFHTYKIGQETE